MNAEFDLKRSKEVVGHLYPVLLDAHGNVVDGFHRLEADPDWPTQKLEWVKDEETREIVRAHANLMRREIPLEERRESFLKLAKHMERRGVKKGKISTELSKVSGFSDRWVRELLPDELKAEQMKREIAEVVPQLPPEPIFTEEEYVCPICGAGYKPFHISRDEHKFELAREGKDADSKT